MCVFLEYIIGSLLLSPRQGMYVYMREVFSLRVAVVIVVVVEPFAFACFGGSLYCPCSHLPKKRVGQSSQPTYFIFGGENFALALLLAFFFFLRSDFFLIYRWGDLGRALLLLPLLLSAFFFIVYELG
jgi:hypothetical protein